MKKSSKRAAKKSAGKTTLRSLGDGRKVGAKSKVSKARMRSLGDARPVRP
jgi:hypothetical protein